MTKNGAWIGDYTFNAKSVTYLAVFLYPGATRKPSRPRWFDLRISFDEGHAPFTAQAYLSRMVEGHTRQSLNHAPLPPEVLSIIVHYVTSGSGRTGLRLVARLRLVCRYWNNILRPILFANIEISKTGQTESLMKTFRACPADTSSPGQHLRTLSIGDVWKSTEIGIPAVETVLLLGLGTHATHLTQLSWTLQEFRHIMHLPLPSPPVPPRITSMLPALLRHLRALHTLHVSHQSLHSCAQLFSIIHALPSLKELELTQVALNRVGPVRTTHVATAAQRLRTFRWSSNTTIDQRAPMAAVAARFCTGNDSNGSAVAQAVSRARWRAGWRSMCGADYDYKADTSEAPYSFLVLNLSTLQLKWSIPPAEENSPIRARLLATLKFYSTLSTVELALKDLDPHLRPHYPLTIILNHEDLAAKVPDLQARLPELMPHAHRLGLITVEAGTWYWE
ncbi:hypothetical protein PsYK624_153630 [Phanerochaete sordida]|uniref:F-box domain-containing protein n=1 Tax=Phanerochaete sordida TaxID=48140 RepID=A0A9P3LM91_9APHY|nr:hypothetical protein PsYK624_153630 [Phanerochaete sordida]